MNYPADRHQYSWPISVLAVVATILAFGILVRIGLIAWLGERVGQTGGSGFIILQGIRFDLVLLGMLLVVPMALTPPLLNFRLVAKYWLDFLRYYLLICAGLFVFLETATPAFIGEYDVRPNFLFVEYLRYPAEVLPMIWAYQKLDLAVAGVLLLALLWPLNRYLKANLKTTDRGLGKLAIPTTLILLILCFAAIRSTFDHRPVNPSTVAFSNDSLINTLPLSSLYSVLYAIYELRHEDRGFAYGQRNENICTQNRIESARITTDPNPSKDIPSALI